MTRSDRVRVGAIPTPVANLMRKSDLKILEKLFSAEIEAAVTDGLHLVQSKSKRMLFLESEGYVQKQTVTLGGRFPVNITGWELTELGRITYCFACDDDPDIPDP